MSRIDLSQPPYQVPCPVCKAFAMAPCKNLLTPSDTHDVRWAHWGLHPELRVKVTNDTWVRWGSDHNPETLEAWIKRMQIHCPTARSLRELMFFAAEKLDMTTAAYLAKYFPEELKGWKLKAGTHVLPP